MTTTTWEPVELQLKTPGVKVWPNPAATHCFIDVPAELSAAQLVLTHPDGRIALRQQVAPSARVDVSALPAGLYFWRLDSQDGPAAAGKLLVRR